MTTDDLRKADPRHMIDGGGLPSALATRNMRVARWHETFPDQVDPVPGTIVHIGVKFLTVEFDGIGPRRVEPRNVTRWSEPRE